jgi:hypothetical protein
MTKSWMSTEGDCSPFTWALVTLVLTGRCELCAFEAVPGDVPTVELVSHLSTCHPDLCQPFETWPDGQVVVFDDWLQRKEFHEGSAP